MTDVRQKADTEKGCWQRRTKHEKWFLICAAVVISVLTIALISVIVVYESKLVHTCKNSECVSQASRTLGMMDRSVNPCEDFYQYACGSYIADESTRDRSVVIDHINKLNDLVKVMLTDNIKYGEPRFLSYPKMLYKSCMDQEKIARDGITPIQEHMEQFGGWPLLKKHWDEESFSWEVLIRQLHENGFPFGYLIEVNHVHENGIRILFQEGMTYPNLTYEGVPNEPVITKYKKMLTDIARRFKADEVTLEKDLCNVIDFEVQLSLFSENNDRVERISLVDLQNKYPITDWLLFARSSLGLHMNSSETVLIKPNYFKKLDRLLNTTSKRVIANYIMAKVHHFIIELIPAKVIRGGEYEPFEVRQKLCIDFIRSNLWLAVSALYQKKYFNESDFEGVNQMIDLLIEEFQETIVVAPWMNEASKEEALTKVETMQKQIAFPLEIMETDKIDNFYGDLGGTSSLSTWTWIKDFITGVIHSFGRTNHIVSRITNFEPKITANGTLEKRKEPIHKSANVMNIIAQLVEHRNAISKYNWRSMGDEAKWLAVSDQVQALAEYRPEYNMLDVRAGILRGAFYHSDVPHYINFGAIGTILAHELIHSIDNRGNGFDGEGKPRSNRTVYSNMLYQQKFKCLVEQYNNYREPVTGIRVNGSRTLEENVADNIGISIAYNAYMKWVKKHGQDNYLPGVDLNGRQLFWVANAQTQCANPSVEKILKQLIYSETAPERFRVIGSVSNNVNFAADFNCPLGSKMNPENQCKLSG